MPSHKIINRRGLPILTQRKNIMLTPAGAQALQELAERLMVSSASIADTAIRALARSTDEEIIELLEEHKHLTPDEKEYLQGHLGAENKK